MDVYNYMTQKKGFGVLDLAKLVGFVTLAEKKTATLALKIDGWSRGFIFLFGGSFPGLFSGEKSVSPLGRCWFHWGQPAFLLDGLTGKSPAFDTSWQLCAVGARAAAGKVFFLVGV